MKLFIYGGYDPIANCNQCASSILGDGFSISAYLAKKYFYLSIIDKEVIKELSIIDREAFQELYLDCFF